MLGHESEVTALSEAGIAGARVTEAGIAGAGVTEAAMGVRIASLSVLG